MTSRALVVDAGPLFALLDAADAAHAASTSLLRSWPGPLVVPVLVVAEVTHLAGKRLGPRAELALLRDLSSGDLSVEPVVARDRPRIAQLVERYADLPLGTVDASVIATGERLGVSSVATLDRRHFSVVRPRHVDAFELLP